MRNDLILLDIKKNLYRKKIIETRKYSHFVERFKKIFNKKVYEPENYLDKKLKECVDDFKSTQYSKMNKIENDNKIQNR